MRILVDICVLCLLTMSCSVLVDVPVPLEGCSAGNTRVFDLFDEVALLRCHLFYGDKKKATKQVTKIDAMVASKEELLVEKENKSLDLFDRYKNYIAEHDVLPIYDSAEAFDLEGELWPIKNVYPIYPARAVSRGVRGFVVVELTVSPSGKVLNPVVVEAEPKLIFNSPSIKAVLQHQYLPRVVNGERVEVSGLRRMLTYSFDENQ